MDLRSLLARLPVRRFKDPPPVVGVLRLGGAIGGFGSFRGGLTLSGLAPAIERAFKLPRLQAVALAVNSPGGSPAQSDLIARRIRDLAREKEVPVLAFCEDVAASGGYWLACAADEIYARETSIIGSIGVVFAGFGFPELLQRIGVERRLYTAGDRKTMLDPFQPVKPDDVERLDAIQQEMHEIFKALVRDRRGDRLKAAEDTLFSGEFWTGKRAVELGLIDGVGEMREVLRGRYGDKVVMRRIEAPRSRWRRLLGQGETTAPGASWLAPRPAPQDWIGGLIAAVEERALWSRFGL